MVDIATDNAIVPDARLCADFDIADDYGGFGDKTGRIDNGMDTLKSFDHGSNPSLEIDREGMQYKPLANDLAIIAMTPWQMIKLLVDPIDFCYVVKSISIIKEMPLP
jgi:hypothetical protein